MQMLPCALVAAQQRAAWFFRFFVLHVRWNSTGLQVSSHGRVRDSKGLASLGSTDGSGYRRIFIDKRSYAVHRLVAAAFLGPPPHPTCWQVNHLDGDPANNHVSNLQYVTAADNLKHAWATSRSRQTLAAKLGKPVHWRHCAQFSWNYCISQSEAVRMLGVKFQAVARCCDGQLRFCEGNDGWYEFRRAMRPRDGILHLDEVWKHASYPGDGQAKIANLMVSNHGRIWQIVQGRDVIGYGSKLKNGYVSVTKSARALLVHRLVAASFLGQPEPSTLQVNHKDGDKSNNHVRNLEYVTPSENTRHSWQQRARLAGRCKPVLARPSGYDGSWQAFRSLTAAASHTGLQRATVAAICKGVKSGASWDFKFASEELLHAEKWRSIVFEGVRRSVE